MTGTEVMGKSDQAPPAAFADTITHFGGSYGETASAAAPGSLPAGYERYEQRALLGQGGMGRVVESLDRQFGRVVAIKEMLGDAGPLARRFVVESLVTANLEHPGIPAVYERGVNDDGRPFYAMRRVRGRTLGDAISEADGLDARLALLPVVVQTAQTLAFAHEHGVIHRDIKPDNIFVGNHGETVVLDWGIAKVRGIPTDAASADGNAAGAGARSQTRHGSVMGTPAYMAPEQAAGKVDAIDERTDVFALGAMLYNVLAGRAPYDGPTAESLVARALDARPEPLARLVPGVPPALDAIVRRAMARDPADRYQSASEMARALEDMMAGALRQRESRAIRVFASAASVLAALGIAFVAVAIWMVIPSLRELGIGAVSYLLTAGIGLALVGVELRTRGRYVLAPLVLALAGSTLLLGVAEWATGQAFVFRAARAPKVIADAATWRGIVTAGSHEAIGNLGISAALAALLLVLWSIAVRQQRRAQSSAVDRASRAAS